MSSIGSITPHDTHSTSQTVIYVTITRPYHPLHNQKVEVVRIRRGDTNDLIITLPDGSHTAIAMADTDYEAPPDDQAENTPPVLDLGGLCRIAKIVEAKQGRMEGKVKEEQ